ncbi:MAG: TonB-dependent receptor [Muribaculaceae bacterium]|nr:TonB-dependent receptor [Muribaculaceae bacterium]
MRKIVLVVLIFFFWQACPCQKVTVIADDTPLERVFRSIMDQTGKNFIYSSDLLEGRRVTIDVREVRLKHALRLIFKDSGISFKMKGKSILLIKDPARENRVHKDRIKTEAAVSDSLSPVMLGEVLVESRLNRHPVSTPDIGAIKLTAEDVSGAPVLFGEADVMKAFQMQPGITQTAEGMAGVSVHGGETDQNMVMLDNVPLYSSDHCMGLFSSFNVDAVGYMDIYKSSVPARYDGRLSSYLDVRTKNGSLERRSGSFRLGLATLGFSLNGPMGKNTAFSIAVRRTWSEVVTLPILGLIRLMGEDKAKFGYSFIDLTGKVTHAFNDRTIGFVSLYYGDDWFYAGDRFENYIFPSVTTDESYDLRWGNIIAQTGLKREVSDEMSGEFTLAYSRFFSTMKQDILAERNGDTSSESRQRERRSNHIGDVILKSDFTWHPADSHRVGFGIGYTLHSFLPERSNVFYSRNLSTVTQMDSTWSYIANEANLYIEDEWNIEGKLAINAGVHGSLFAIDGKIHSGVSPRLSLSYNPSTDVAFKLAYSRSVQYVHRLSQAYVSLPTDQWVPITGGFRPQTSDKISAGAYWLSDDRRFSASVEGYFKWMNNLIDYKDEYYLKPPMDMWNAMLCCGKGSAKGIDFKIEKRTGNISGHISYSLGWADRKFAEKNGGKAFPARLDHRHTLNVLANWDISDKVRLSAVWTGHSGSRFTLMTQTWTGIEETDVGWWYEQSALKTELNRYSFPFYHRLDLSCIVKNKRGYWNFSLYNAYCHMNTIGIRRAYDDEGKPVFQKVALLPIIPSFSYTWQF